MALTPVSLVRGAELPTATNSGPESRPKTVKGLGRTGRSTPLFRCLRASYPEISQSHQSLLQSWAEIMQCYCDCEHLRVAAIKRPQIDGVSVRLSARKRLGGSRGLDTIIENTHFNLTGKSEREFELALALGDVVVLKATHAMN